MSKAGITLKMLCISSGKLSPDFNPARTDYCVHVTNDTGYITVTPATGVPGAAVTVNGAVVENDRTSKPINLCVGRNLISVEVISQDKKIQNSYVVKVIRSYPTPAWVKVKEKIPWAPRDSAGEFVFNNRMWLCGGFTPPLVNDVWSSGDGTNWTEVGAIPCKSGINVPINFVYDDKMWITSNDGELFSSRDGINWSLVTDQAPWKGRYAAGGVVFAGKMWIMGGCKNGAGILNDIWSSTDGVQWTLEVDSAAWSKRQFFSTLAVHDHKLWLLGGGITRYHPFKAYGDVWNSPDGKNWTKVTDCAPWPPRIWSSSVVYKNRLWLLGGFQSEPTWRNFNDVWYSSDGVHWNQLFSEIIWSPRHELSAYVFNDKLWVIGGNMWPLMNDVWYLEISGLTFLTQPVIEEFVKAEYSYRTYADFNQSNKKVCYRLVDSPDWLTINSKTGLIRGTPDTVEDVQVTVEAYDEAGETAQQSYTLHILPIGVCL